MNGKMTAAVLYGKEDIKIEKVPIPPLELGEVLVPAIYPFSWKHDDESVWLGRITDWMTDQEHGDFEYPLGQKVLLVDGEEVPFLEIRSLEFHAAQAAAT